MDQYFWATTCKRSTIKPLRSQPAAYNRRYEPWGRRGRRCADECTRLLAAGAERRMPVACSIRGTDEGASWSRRINSSSSITLSWRGGRRTVRSERCTTSSQRIPAGGHWRKRSSSARSSVWPSYTGMRRCASDRGPLPAVKRIHAGKSDRNSDAQDS